MMKAAKNLILDLLVGVYTDFCHIYTQKWNCWVTGCTYFHFSRCSQFSVVSVAIYSSTNEIVVPIIIDIR